MNAAGVGGIVLLGFAAAAPALEVMTHSLEQAAVLEQGRLQPLPHGGVRAFSLAVVQRLLARLQVEATIREVPLARGVQRLAAQQPAVLFTLLRTPAREAQYQWVGPLYADRSWLYAYRERPVTTLSKPEAKLVPVCAVRGGAHEERLRAEGFANITLGSSYVGCLKMLKAGRVLLTPLIEADYPGKLSEAELQPRDLVNSGWLLLQSDNYIALSQAVPAAETERWNRELAAMRQEGELERLRQLYWPGDAAKQSTAESRSRLLTQFAFGLH